MLLSWWSTVFRNCDSVVQCNGGCVVSTWKNCSSFGITKHTSHVYRECCRFQECKFNTANCRVLQLLFHQTCFLFRCQSVTGELRKWLGMNKKHVFSLPPSLYDCCNWCCLLNAHVDWSSQLILLGPCDWCWPELVMLICSCPNWCGPALLAE